jgi:hypothetical protein
LPGQFENENEPFPGRDAKESLDAKSHAPLRSRVLQLDRSIRRLQYISSFGAALLPLVAEMTQDRMK